VEDALILFIVSRFVRMTSKDTQIVPFLHNSLNNMMEIYEKKKKLRKILDYIFWYMIKDAQYGDSVKLQLERRVIYTVSPNIGPNHANGHQILSRKEH